MSKILVSGLINIETSCPIKEFPIEYFPIDYPFGKVNSCISGVGFNLISNLKQLGDNITFVSLLGDDLFGKLIFNELEAKNIPTKNIYKILSATPQTVILYDSSGKREIYCDLKDYQEASLDFSNLKQELEKADIIIACNSNFNRPLLKIASQMNKKIATDVHVFSNIDDEYNKDFLGNANILFMSDEGLKDRDIKNFVLDLYNRFNNEIIVVGCGNKGALLFEANNKEFTEIPAVYTRPVVATSGAGDTLFSSFVHFIAKGIEAKESLQLASIAASYKIGEAGSSKGFLDESGIYDFYKECF
ncbi:MAG: carbohydrate kinase family protein [Candidatus Riflebacteria bacterium]|nr:carbohydrate kinase family protein [Candidatus Riflebacteria bacterium]